MAQTIAITGGSGFIGSHVVDALLEAGHTVRVLDTRAPHTPEAEWLPVDINDQARLTQALRGTDATFHLAAMADVNDIFAAPLESVALNTLGTARVLEAARQAEAGRVILASTVWVYAATTGDRVDETTPFVPETDRHLYVSSKVAAEMFCRDYQTLYQRPYTVLRYGIPYGPRMRDNLVIAAFIRRALQGETLKIDGDGRQERRFVYIEDLARAHVLALNPAAENRTYNLDGDRGVSIREIAETVKEQVGDITVEYGPSRPGDFAARDVRSDRARDELGWTPQVDFAEGMQRTLTWFRERVPQKQTVSGDD